jgi:acyltransferase
MELIKEKRLEWPDNAKGIGIISVILAHTYLNYTWMGDFINSFHMPLFFFLSGYFFSIDKYGSFSLFLRHKASTLLKPYLIFALLSYLYFLTRYHFGDQSYFQELSVYQQFFGIFYSAGTKEWMDFNVPLWFLTCLFIVEALFYWCRKLIRKTTHIYFALILFSIIGYLDGFYNSYKLPWGIDVALTAVVFYGLGHLGKTYCQALLAKPAAVRLLLSVLFLAVTVGFMHEKVNLNMKLHSYYYDFYICAIAGIMGCLLVSSMIHSRFIRFLGRNALIIMAVHMPLLNVAAKILTHAGAELHPIPFAVVQTVITIVLTIPVILAIHRFTPFIVSRGTRQPAGLSIQAKH